MSSTNPERSDDTPRGVDELTSSVDPELVLAWLGRARRGAGASFGSIVILVISLVLTTSASTPKRGEERPMSPAAIVLFVAFLAALGIGAWALHAAKIAKVLDGATWRTSPGEHLSSSLQLEQTQRSYVPAFKLFASHSLYEQSSFEWAGDPAAHIVVRVPGERRLTLYRACRTR